MGQLAFINAGNANHVNPNAAAGSRIAQIISTLVTTDSNAGDDSGGDLQFWTKPEAGLPAERMRILSDGKVGIGTTEPERPLHVIGGIHLNNASVLSWDAADGNLRNTMYVDSGDDLIIGDTNFDDIYFSTGQKTKTVVIKQTTGNVGIGTDAPEAALTVAGPDYTHAIFRTNQSTASQRAGGGFSSVGHATAASRFARLFLDADGGNFSGADYFTIEKFGGGHDNPGGEVKLMNYSDADMSFWVNTSIRAMTIREGGNVGIGIAAPESIFHVYGTSWGQVLLQAGAVNVAWDTLLLKGLGSGAGNVAANADAVLALGDYTGPASASLITTGRVGIGTTNPTYLLHVKGAGGDVQVTSTTATNRAGFQSANAGGTSYFYKESSVGGGTLAGTAAYATVVGELGAYPLQLGTNNAVRMTIDSAGDTTFTGDLAVAGSKFALGGGSASRKYIWHGYGFDNAPSYYTIGTIDLSSVNYYGGLLEGTITCGRGHQNSPTYKFRFKFYKTTGVATGFLTVWSSSGSGSLNVYVDDSTEKIFKFVVFNNGFNAVGLTYDITYTAGASSLLSDTYVSFITAVSGNEGSASAPSGYSIITKTFQNADNHNDGYVGIGTNAPIGALNVRGADQTKQLVISNSTYESGTYDNETGLWFKGNFSSGDERAKAAIFLKGKADYGVGDLVFAIDGGADNNNAALADEKMRITSDGKVGIGTTGPSTPLHVWSTSWPQFRVSYNSSLYFTLDHAATLNVYGNDWYVRLNSSEKFRIKQDGKIGIGTNNPLSLLTLHQAAGANIRFSNPTTGRYFIVGEGVGAPDKFSFRGNSYRSTDTLTVDFANNRVGVNNIAPATTLDVTGVTTARDYIALGASAINGSLTWLTSSPARLILFGASRQEIIAWIKRSL